jgi:hypothetical protein
VRGVIGLDGNVPRIRHQTAEQVNQPLVA